MKKVIEKLIEFIVGMIGLFMIFGFPIIMTILIEKID